MKIKTFTFEDNRIFRYNDSHNHCEGEFYYISMVDKINNQINNFISNNNIEVVDIKINNIVRGNNPPTSILIYTIVYKEKLKGVDENE